MAVAVCGVPLVEGLVTVRVTVSAGVFLDTSTVAVICVSLTTSGFVILTPDAETVSDVGPPGSEAFRNPEPVKVISCVCPAHQPSGVTEVMVSSPTICTGIPSEAMQLAVIIAAGVATGATLALVAARTGAIGTAPMINSPTPMHLVSVGSEASGVTVAVAFVSLMILMFVIDTFPVSTVTLPKK